MRYAQLAPLKIVNSQLSNDQDSRNCASSAHRDSMGPDAQSLTPNAHNVFDRFSPAQWAQAIAMRPHVPATSRGLVHAYWRSAQPIAFRMKTHDRRDSVDCRIEQVESPSFLEPQLRQDCHAALPQIWSRLQRRIGAHGSRIRGQMVLFPQARNQIHIVPPPPETMNSSYSGSTAGV